MAIEETGLAAASEELVADFERLVAKTTNIAELIEEISNASTEFHQLITDTLTACDGEAKDMIVAAAQHSNSASAELLTLQKDFAASVKTMSGEAVDLVQTMGTDLGSALDDGIALMSDAEIAANAAVAELASEVKGLLGGLSSRLGEIDALWLEAQSAQHQIQNEVRTAILGFSSELGKEIEDLDNQGQAFASDLEKSVFKPVEDLLDEVQKVLGDFGAKVFEKGFAELGGQLDKAIRAQVAELIDEAITEIKTMVTEKIDDILERRDKSEPERRALDAIFDTLKAFVGDVENGAGEVGKIRAVVGG